MELTFTREDIPKIVRAGGSGREAEPWETHLAPLKETPGESFRVWTYEKRTSAVSRMSGVRNRLTQAVPHENWQLAVRQVPGATEEQYGVYVAYVGVFSAEEIAQNAADHEVRSERVKAARAAAEAKRAAEPVAEPDTLTAKERVAKAKAEQVAKAS